MLRPWSWHPSYSANFRQERRSPPEIAFGVKTDDTTHISRGWGEIYGWFQ